MNILNFGNVKIIESVHLTIQFRFPRTKKRRIRKKWAKRSENFKPREEVLYDKERNLIYAHPIIAHKLRIYEKSITR